MGAVGVLLVGGMLTEIFVTYLLPRRVKRDPRIVRAFTAQVWRPWRWIATRLPAQSADTMLGVYGPLWLIANLVIWVSLMMLGYACLQWAAGSHLLGTGAHDAVSFGEDLYFSAATMASTGTSGLSAHTGLARAVQVFDAASGLAVIATVIGYLPSLYQAFSDRETTVSQLDARAASPPTAGRLLVRSADRGGWPAINAYLGSWEPWVAELMESHLSYPVLVFFRSQHLNQSWLAAMCTILDACSFTAAAAPEGTVDEARFTWAIARHAVVDLSWTFKVRPLAPAEDRLPPGDLAELLSQLAAAGAPAAAEESVVAERLTRLRGMYEPYVNALSRRTELPLPQWLSPEEPTSNWRTTSWH